MGHRFIENAYKGRNQWLHYLVILGGAEFYWRFFGYSTLLLGQGILSLLSLPAVVVERISGHLPFAVVFAWLAFMMPAAHERPCVSLINAEAAINFRRILQGGFAYAGISMVWVFIDVWIYPAHYAWQFDPMQWFPLLIFSLLLVPIQTSIEELLFRGYIMQGLRLLTRHSFVIVIVSSLLFSMIHWGNPEMGRGAFVWGALNYFTWGIIFAVITLKDNGLELAFGVHAANNIVSSVLVTTPDSVIQTPAMYAYLEPIDPRHSLVALLIDGAIFYAIFFGGIPRLRTDCLDSQSEKS